MQESSQVSVAVCVCLWQRTPLDSTFCHFVWGGKGTRNPWWATPSNHHIRSDDHNAHVAMKWIRNQTQPCTTFPASNPKSKQKPKSKPTQNRNPKKTRTNPKKMENKMQPMLWCVFGFGKPNPASCRFHFQTKTKAKSKNPNQPKT